MIATAAKTGREDFLTFGEAFVDALPLDDAGDRQQANMLLMTIPGIPVIYQGTEQGFTETRAAMFAEGWESGGVDNFDTSSEMYQFIAQLAEMRKAHPLVTKGSLTIIADNEAALGCSPTAVTTKARQRW